ncbi:hypothetical protein [Micromonospora sp. SH-82]|uniref:hypothetical protein n=1 Tax=Micromonospora sp. SH-82 TaxID=3132938 RepID=UPI003EB6E75C
MSPTPDPSPIDPVPPPLSSQPDVDRLADHLTEANRLRLARLPVDEQRQYALQEINGVEFLHALRADILRQEQVRYGVLKHVDRSAVEPYTGWHGPDLSPHLILTSDPTIRTHSYARLGHIVGSRAEQQFIVDQIRSGRHADERSIEQNQWSHFVNWSALNERMAEKLRAVMPSSPAQTGSPLAEHLTPENRRLLHGLPTSEKLLREEVHQIHQLLHLSIEIRGHERMVAAAAPENGHLHAGRGKELSDDFLIVRSRLNHALGQGLARQLPPADHILCRPGRISSGAARTPHRAGGAGPRGGTATPAVGRPSPQVGAAGRGRSTRS